MTASVGKRILKWTVLITPWLLTTLLAAGWGLSTWTPGYLEKLVPELASEMGLPLEEFHIRDAGLFSADIGPIRLGSEDGGLQLANVHITYTPASLKQGRVNSVEIQGVSLSCFYANGQFKLPALDLLPKTDNSEAQTKGLPSLPLDSLTVKESVLHCSVEGKQFSIPFSATITPGNTIEFEATLTPRDQRLTIAGKLGPTIDNLTVELSTKQFLLGALTDLLPQPVGADIDLDVNATVNLADLDSIKAEVTAVATRLDLPGTDIQLAEGNTITLQASLTGKSIDFSLAPVELVSPHPMQLSISQGHASHEAITADFTLNTMGVHLPGQLKADCKDNVWDVSLTTANPDKLSIETGGRTVHLAGIDVSMTGSASVNTADLILKGSTRGAYLDGVPARSGPVRFSLPLAWPAPTRHTPGKLKVSNLHFEKYKLGTITAQMRQQGMGIGLEGALHSQLLPDLAILFSGQASMETKDANFSFDVPRYVVSDKFDPSILVPALADVKLTGNLSAEGGLTIHDGKIQSNMGVFVTDGSLVMGEEGTTRIDGIRLYFESPDLMNFRSAPAQLLGFDSLTAGPISIGKGRVTFQLEPRGVVLVEHMGFDWVGGHVASRAFRIVPGHEVYDVTLFCSQLSLSSLLKQLGLADAQGKATLSGELPVTWKRGKISFNNGFLHSTPGQGGVIQVQAMQDLVSAIPEGTPQRGQLELAQAAIKDFEYKWVRIKADTVGEDLLVRLSLDGKPAGTLPFIYRKEFGGFARVTGDVKGSNFQGLRLDVNFSLPLDRILLYKDIINMIE